MSDSIQDVYKKVQEVKSTGAWRIDVPFYNEEDGSVRTLSVLTAEGGRVLSNYYLNLEDNWQDAYKQALKDMKTKIKELKRDL